MSENYEDMRMVKIKAPEGKVAYFITPQATLTRLRIHAMMLRSDRAEQYAAELRENNPGSTVKVVDAFA